MTTGTWDPDAGASAGLKIDAALLQRFVAAIDQGHGDDLAANMTEEDLAQHDLMRIPLDEWPSHLEPLEGSELLALVRFFTLIEMQSPDWHAGDLSPVIAINRLLRARGQKLDTDTLKWIRTNSTNRFIPNGAVL